MMTVLGISVMTESDFTLEYENFISEFIDYDCINFRLANNIKFSTQVSIGGKIL